jgi:VIT1/CCC1 family predicted Fe2+/Mn2+ transporter
LVPLLPFLLNFENAILYAIIYMAAYLLLIGIVRAYLVGKNVIYGAMEILFVGILASSASYFVGNLIENVLSK